jgi:hypothetical protein
VYQDGLGRIFGGRLRKPYNTALGRGNGKLSNSNAMLFS